MYLTNTTNNWTGDLINEATLNLSYGNGVSSGAGFRSFINNGQFATISSLAAANDQNVRVNNLSGTASTGLVLYANNTSVTSTLPVLSLVSSTYAGGIVNSVLDRNRGAMSLVKQGGATLTLTGTTNWYNGITDVQSGTLDIASIRDAGLTLNANSYTAHT